LSEKEIYMSRILFELESTEGGGFRIETKQGSVPSHKGMGCDDAGGMADYDHCMTPGEALRVYADALDRAMAVAWWENVAPEMSVGKEKS
jgi:hypothetical protein